LTGPDLKALSKVIISASYYAAGARFGGKEPPKSGSTLKKPKKTASMMPTLPPKDSVWMGETECGTA